MTLTTMCTSKMAIPLDSFEYPEGPLADALEAEVARTLPLIPGLEAAVTHDERMAVYARTIRVQMAQFVAAHGGPFGASVVRPDASCATAKALTNQESPTSAKA